MLSEAVVAVKYAHAAYGWKVLSGALNKPGAWSLALLAQTSEHEASLLILLTMQQKINRY